MFMSIEKNVGNVIRANIHREMSLNHMTQQSISEQLGVSQSTVSRYLESAEKMTFEQIIRFSRAIGCDYRDLLIDVFVK